jgi:hypothetical protein
MDAAIAKTGMAMPMPTLAPVLRPGMEAEAGLYVGLEVVVEEVDRGAEDEVEVLVEEVDRGVEDEVEALVEEVGEVMLK